MSEFHYVRTLGAEGGVDAVEGPAVGLDLDTVLKDGLPPFKVALEIIAAMCEIIDIADQDNESHGEIIPRFVFIDETGAVSMEGYGTKRTRTAAPERAPKGTQTDIWGLGYCAFRMMSAKDLPSNLPDEAQAYDDAIIDAIVGINFEDLPEEIVGDIQWFLAKMMSFEREDRPGSVDVWRTFIAFADSVQGPRLDDWSNAALGGGGERRDRQKAAQKPEPPRGPDPATEEEDLGGPVMQKGPLAKGGLSFDGGGKKGQATAFWSKEDMKKALESDDEGERKPKIGGGSATSFWSTEQMKAMSEGKADAPRPKRKENASRPATMMMKPPKREDEEPDLDRPAPVKPVAAPPPVIKQAPLSPPPVIKQAPSAPLSPPPMLPPPQAPEPAAEGGSNMGLIVGGVVVVLMILLCGGLVVGGGGIGMIMSSGADQAAAEAEAERKAAEEKAEAERKAAEEKAEAERKEAEEKAAAEKAASEAKDPKKPEGKSTSPIKPVEPIKPGTTKPATTKPATTTTKPAGSTRPKTTTTAAPVASGPVVLKVRSSSRGKLRCSDGQGPSFDGIATLEFDPGSLPVNCMVDMDGAKGIITIEKSMTVTCNVSGSEVICS